MSVMAKVSKVDDELRRRGGRNGGQPGGRASPSAARLGLWLLMAVVTVLFLQLIHAYVVRLGLDDWRPLPMPWQLWLNTTMLILSSVALQWTQFAARRGQRGPVTVGLLIAGAFAIAFLGGQLWAWQQLSALNYLVASNPANSFFYLITGLHGMHLLGGLVAWWLTSAKVRRGLEMERVYLSVQLCARYWHFLLALWLVLFALLFLIPAATIQMICASF
jgi:cytochrome c oxidase subunit 3